MDDAIATIESDSYIDWNTEDELDIENTPVSSCLDTAPPTSYNGSTSSLIINHFLEMGFPEHLVIRAVNQSDYCDQEDAVLEAILTYSVLEESPHNEGYTVQNAGSSETDSNSCDLVYEPSNDGGSAHEESMDQSWGKATSFSLLIEMGYEAQDALAAIDTCGKDAPIEELIHFIAGNDADDALHYSTKRRKTCYNASNKKKKLKRNKSCLSRKQNDYDDDQVIHIPLPMIGFGVPNQPLLSFQRHLGEDALGPPYFYYENVALAPKGVWSKISKFLYDIQPEFVDSHYFCAANRKRGYVHNLPVHNRFQLIPVPPSTIQEAFPLSTQWWPSWDNRTKLNCILTCIGSFKIHESIKKALEKFGDKEPSQEVKKHIVRECKKFNLVWVGKNKVAPLDPHEVEELMGFPQNHTRGGGITMTGRYKFLGNAFQVDTVAYHLSVLRDMYPEGINVLSLFTGIGGAEVALHRLGIRLKNVVSVEISESCRRIVDCWWKESGQTGNLIHASDVQEVTAEQLEKWIYEVGGFDLVIGGSPCNNLAGRNYVSRVGLEGKQSSLFYEYYRILFTVRTIMGCQS